MAQNLRIMLTAGPTHEPIDAVRYLANRSSGRLGLALASAAVAAGCHVRLLLGPVPDAPAPEALAGVALDRFTTAAELQALLERHFGDCDVLIMAAAVADYRPAGPVDCKLPRTGDKLTLELEPTPDLVAECAARKRPDQLVIAFALEEPDQLESRAAEKLRRKGVDAIVANPLATMGAAEIDAALLTPDGRVERTGPLSKPDFARWLIDWIIAGRASRDAERGT